MTQVHVITKENEHLYQEQMEEYFHLRQEIFVNERGWRDLNCIGGREIDAYDNENAVYLLAIDQNRVVGGTEALSDPPPAHVERGL
jgi:acyl-homoserine lactone synthase